MDIFRLEEDFQDEGYKSLLGIDEVGRGAIAGPLVVAGVILPPFFRIEGLNDSKKLTRKKREQLSGIIRKNALAYEVIYINEEMIEALNIYAATKYAMEEVYRRIKVRPDLVLSDAIKLNIDCNNINLIKGDQKSASIAAASIIAKVERDQYMEKMDLKYKGYGFSKHKGYCTKLHQEKLNLLGPCKIHRKSFYPVSSFFTKYKQCVLDLD